MVVEIKLGGCVSEPRTLTPPGRSGTLEGPRLQIYFVPHQALFKTWIDYPICPGSTDTDK